MADLHWMSLGSPQTLSKVSQSPPSVPLVGWSSLIQPDQKQQTSLVVVEVLVVVKTVVGVVETEVEVVRVDGGSVVDGVGVVDLQIQKVWFTVLLGPQISE